jgi:DNA-binding PadR family transcriptional regulator
VRRSATTANAILGLLALRGESRTYDLTQQLRRNLRFFWPRAESRIYDEVKTLSRRGLTSSRSEAKPRPHTAYSITPEGRRSLEDWLAQPPSGTALQCEPLLRVLLADLAPHERLRASIERIRQDAAEILEQGRVVAPEYLAGTAPFQDQVHVRALVFDFLSHFALMLDGWSDRAEAAIEAWPELSAEERAARALESIRRDFAAFPPVDDSR